MADASIILVDSDAFIAWLIVQDAHHNRVRTALDTLNQSAKNLTTTSFVIAETATLLSRRYAQAHACRFIRFLHSTEFPVIEITGEVRQQAKELFQNQKTEKVSLIDCANVIAAQRFEVAAILGFDHFYRRFGIPMVEESV